MANSNSSEIGKWILGGIAVIGVSAFAGYYLGTPHGSQASRSVTSVSQPSLPTTSGTLSAPADTAKHDDANPKGDYTAPGSPKIQIEEEPVQPSSSHKVITAGPAGGKTPAKDAEASQEAAPPVQTADSSTADGAATDGADTAAGSTDTNSTTPNGTDQDYEKIIPSPAETPDNRPLFRVEAGSFGQLRNARILADALKARGYTASARADQQGDKTVYRVQTGAYHTRTAANRAALELKQQGYPATVSPIAP